MGQRQEWVREDTGVGERDRSERKGERQEWERERKDKQRFRVGERRIGREIGVVEREREKKDKRRDKSGREREIESRRE